jgi:5-methylcytosine-specific restriction endonuclease McrA
MTKSYADYLLTDKWKNLRRLALARDHNLCQGCREWPATQVHHLTYTHLGEEFLFELVSLCHFCHERIHRTDGSD